MTFLATILVIRRIPCFVLMQTVHVAFPKDGPIISTMQFEQDYFGVRNSWAVQIAPIKLEFAVKDPFSSEGTML